MTKEQIVEEIIKSVKSNTNNLKEGAKGVNLRLIQFVDNTFAIECCDEQYLVDRVSDLKSITKMLTNKLFKKYVIECDDVNVSSSLYYSDYIQFPSRITLFSKPCKEFNKINKILIKNGKTPLEVCECYNVSLFGKRGQYDENGKRLYLCYCESLCQSILDVLKSKTSRDILDFSIKTTDDIDTDYSIRYETECYGNRYIMPKIEVKTPKGKVKNSISWGYSN